MWFAIRYPIASSIPTIDSPIMQSECLQLWSQSLLQFRERIFTQIRSKKRPKARNILIVEFEHRLAYPLRSERDSRALLSQVIAGVACIDRLPEKCNSRLLPETTTEQ